jgi:hypothetical protein
MCNVHACNSGSIRGFQIHLKGKERGEEIIITIREMRLGKERVEGEEREERRKEYTR